MIGWKFVKGLAVAALIIPLAPSTTWAQIRDQVIVYASTGEVSEPVVMCRYSRNLQLLGTTGTAGEVWETLGASNPMAVDGAGNHWICAGPLSGTKLIRIDRDGALLPSALLGHNPVAITATSSGTMVALTRVPLVAAGPVYAVDPSGRLCGRIQPASRATRSTRSESRPPRPGRSGSVVQRSQWGRRSHRRRVRLGSISMTDLSRSSRSSPDASLSRRRRWASSCRISTTPCGSPSIAQRRSR